MPLFRSRPMVTVVMSLRLGTIGAPLVAGYALAVLAFDQMVAAGTIPLDAFASSPVDLLHGQLWTMLTSGLVSADNLPILHTVGLATVLVAFAARHGGGAVLRCALAAHIGSALLAYAGLLLVTGAGLVSDTADLTAADYGTSCVWFGCVAGLLAMELVALRRRPLAGGLALAAGVAAIMVSTPISEDPLTTVEHLLAIAIGVGVGVRLARPQRSSIRSTGSARRASGCSPVIRSR